MGTVEDVKLRILTFLADTKEATAKQLEEKAGCANKTFLKARQQLEKEGLIKKNYELREGGGLKAIYRIPEEKRQTVEIILQRASLKQRIDKADFNEIQFLKKKIEQIEIQFFEETN